MDLRDFNDPRYKKWRRAVYGRDHFQCKMPGCTGGDKRLEAHHIKRWAEFPKLRFVVSNGITLCKLCHDRIKDREHEFESTFQSLVTGSSSNHRVELLFLKYGKPEKEG